MTDRRKFLKLSGLGLGGLFVSTRLSASSSQKQHSLSDEAEKPVVLSTWNHGVAANAKAWEIIDSGGTAIDAVQQGVMVTESDPESMSVGYGGLPDRDGIVTLDACIMDHEYNCGAVAYLQNIKNPVAVARKVMDETPHVMLSGKGALDFALANGFKSEDLLTDKAKAAWKKWLETSDYKPKINVENHDTIGMIALDKHGNLAGACTTSGVAYKIHGRVGDSPIIGAGLYVDGEIGAACATGLGETVIKVAGSAMVVELMRHGKSPEEACKEVVERICSKIPNADQMQVGFLALRKDGTYGSYAIHKGFNYALTHGSGDDLVDSHHHFPVADSDDKK